MHAELKYVGDLAAIGNGTAVQLLIRIEKENLLLGSRKGPQKIPQSPGCCNKRRKAAVWFAIRSIGKDAFCSYFSADELQQESHRAAERGHLDEVAAEPGQRNSRSEGCERGDQAAG